MRWTIWLLLVLLATPAVLAIRTNIDSSQFLTAFHEHYDEGVCTYDIEPTLGSGSNAWPSDSSCAEAGSYLYRFSNSRIILQSPGNHNANTRATLGYDTRRIVFNWIDNFVLDTVSASSFNNFVRSDITGVGRGFPVFSFGWCGQSVRVTYDKTTVAPTTAFSESPDDTPSCPDWLYLEAFGVSENSRSFFTNTQTGKQRPFTLPMQTTCDSYSLRIDARTHNEWGVEDSVRRITQSGNTHTYYHSINNGHDEITVRLTENSSGHLQSISVDAEDGSPNYGGSIFTVFCLKTEPQVDPTECVAPNAWSDAVHTSNPGFACCGAAPVQSGDIHGNYQCVRETDGNHAWNDVTDICSYPSGWRIGSLSEQEIQEDARTTYREGLCCSNPINHGRVLADGTVCAALPNNYSRWMDPTVNATVERISESDTRMLVSDGNEWITCNTEALEPTSIPVRAAPLTGDAGACSGTGSADAQCQSDFDQCMLPCPIGHTAEDVCFNVCRDAYDACMSAPQTSSCAAPLSCNAQNLCVCPTGQAWNPATNSCENTCPQGTTMQNNECVGTITYTPHLFTNATTCELVQGPGVEYICFDRWRSASESAVHYLDITNTPLLLNDEPNPDKRLAEAACIDGAINNNKHFNPTKDDFGFCDPNQCYAGTQNAQCVEQHVWIDNDYCIAVGGGMEWETRTRFLADALINSTENAQFILHCDSTTEAINDPTRPLLYENADLINAFCVLSEPDGDNPVVGVTLNFLGTAANIGDAAISAAANQLRPFITTLNNTKEFGNANAVQPCANTLGSTAYEQCDGFIRGDVHYNSELATLVFSESTFEPEPTFFGALRNWWNGARFGETQLMMPLTGHKIYVAKGNDRSIQARLYYNIPDGREEAKIIAYNIPEVNDQCTYAEGQTAGKFTCEYDSDEGITIVTIDRPTQIEWESFTLRVRP